MNHSVMSNLGFEELHTLMDEYASKYLSDTESNYMPILLAEAKKRIRQLRRLLMITFQLSDRIHSLQPQIAAIPPFEGSDPPTLVVELLEATDSIEMYTEAFYYIAWRLRQVIRSLPELKSFDPRGVRFVRNHMIEHPEKHSQDVLWAFSINNDVGPVLLRASGADERALDRGLWPNATEFAGMLREKLEKAISDQDGS